MPKRTKKIIIITATALALITAGAVLWYAKERHDAPTQQDSSSDTRGVNSVDYSAPNKNKDKTVESDKDKTAKDEQAQGDDGTTTNPQQSALGTTITAATQDGDSVFIRATATGATSGTCTLTLTKDGSAPITRTAALAAQANYVICQGFNLQTSDFSSAGSWKAMIKVESDGASAQAEKELTIQK